MSETREIMESAEQTMTPELRDQLIENYMESAQEAEKSGNSDMAEYYKTKARELQEADAGSDGGPRLGGWYAGYTPGEWRRMADKEYAKNGNSMKYRDYIKNAQKAEG